ncbi:MAG: hypothetical protein MRZ79_18395 [Bacteroidia bacterium]|nr:hypothetical protein [Bacteroidia bacterium]
MKPYISTILIFTVLLASCNQQKDNSLEENVVKMEGELSYFSCSDSLLNHRFNIIRESFEEKMDLSKAEWQKALPYFRLVKPLLDSSITPAAVDMLWNTYLQTGNKLDIINHPIWAQTPDSLFDDSEALGDQLMLHEKYQRLAYMAIALKKNEFAQKSLQISTNIYQSQVKDKYSNEEQSLGDGLDLDLLALSMDLIPKDDARAIVRNVFEKLLEDGLDPSAFPLSQASLLSTLSKYEKTDLAYRIQPNMDDAAVAAWMIKDLAGIRPSLNAPGFRNPIIQPKLLPDLDFVEGQLKTPYGLLFIRIEKSKPMRIQVKIPAKATLVLPVKDPTRASIMANKTRLWMGGKPQPSPPGVTFLDVSKDGIIVELAKGKYTFQIKE